MHQVTGVLVSVLTLLLSFNHAELSTCQTDCLHQAGVPCEIISSTTECPTRPVDSGPAFPDLPSNVKVSYYVVDTIPHLNVTWAAPQTGLEFVQAFELEFWNYLANADPDATRGPDGEFGLCVQYNMTRGIHPERNSAFHHDCDHPTQHYLSLASLPRESDHHYVHRVVAVYKQGAEYSALWQPPLVTIHNDSCQRVVEVQVVLAPEHYGFNHYRVALRYADDNIINDSDSYDFFVDPGQETYDVRFIDVENDQYVITIYPQPNDRGALCQCPNCGGSGCKRSKTGAFVINDDHMKCQLESGPIVSTSQLSPQSPVQNTLVMIVLSVFCFFLIFLIAAIFLIRCLKRPNDKTDEGGLDSQRKVKDWDVSGPSVAGPNDSAIFEDWTSKDMAIQNDNQSEQFWRRNNSIQTRKHMINNNNTIEMRDINTSGPPVSDTKTVVHVAVERTDSKQLEQSLPPDLEETDSQLPYVCPSDTCSICSGRGESWLGSVGPDCLHFGEDVNIHDYPDPDMQYTQMAIRCERNNPINCHHVYPQIPTGKKVYLNSFAENEQAF